MYGKWKSKTWKNPKKNNNNLKLNQNHFLLLFLLLTKRYASWSRPFNELINFSFFKKNQKFKTERQTKNKYDSRAKKSTFTLHVHCLPFLSYPLSLSLFKFMICRRVAASHTFFLNRARTHAGSILFKLLFDAVFDFKYSNMDIWCWA